jgi:hypothetical protein
MSTHRNLIYVSACAGLVIAPTAWIINTQLGQTLPYLDCQQQARWSAVASFIGAAASCLAALISWRSAARANVSGPLPTLAFVGSASALTALVFTFALSMQGLASLVLSGCER